uniref:Clp R domain-containing protein n=1 Tax=Oryza brachyantha TaxID=4533 RepID=J3LCQ8_ORYBR
MRAGVYTVHQALSADAAAVLKLALALARCRGHAQLTPLHVAFTLLRSSSSSSDPAPFACSGDASSSSSSCCAYGLLRRACLQSLQAQQQSSQQPLLAIKVELDQLVISILDDPSVSRVMREAGFSSAAVKTSLEEEGAMLPSIGHHICYSSSSPASCVSPVFSHDPHIDFNASGAGSSWPAQFLHHPGTGSSCEEDVSAILEVMMRKQGARTNPVVVGDSVSVADALVAELMRRLNTGDVPDELRGVHVLSLHLSCVHLRLMTRADVDAQVAELRRTANSIADDKAAGLVIYVGDLRWAIDDDGDQALADHSTSEDHMVTELARLLAELRAASRGRAWLVAAASYQTYMRCQQRRQPVVVPADAGTSLALGRRAPLAPAPSREGEDGKTTKLGEISMVDVASGEDGGVPAFCADCADGYEKEASLVKAKAEGTTLALTYFPGWPQANEPLTSHKAELMELRRKWGSLCQRVHCHRLKHQASIASPLPWWCTSVGRRDVEERAEWNPTSPGLRLSFGTPAGHGRSESADEQG